MSDMQLEGTYITICDWHGIVKWIGGTGSVLKEGDTVWDHLGDDSQEQAKVTFARVVSLREKAVIELENARGNYFRAWIWPLDSPEMAVCILSVALPKSLQELTPREREILNLMSQSKSIKEIAANFDVSFSTVHTHLRRVRKKLNLTSSDSLYAYAIRYCHPQLAISELQLAAQIPNQKGKQPSGKRK